ncbi:hypothetical protein [Deinococcus yunweiensis]|uniref:hypothetical protein n=1 Tax=Deinococcus yunweiensis TaxID=367282 RepID=UPI00398F606F
MHELIGVTGWTYGYIATLTVPQFFGAMAGRGRMLRPTVQALLDVQRATNLSDRPGAKGEPSSVDRVIAAYEATKRGETPESQPGDRRFGHAVDIVLMPYRGDPDRGGPVARPFPGMEAREARALIAWVREGRCPPDVWALELLPRWEEIAAVEKTP